MEVIISRYRHPQKTECFAPQTIPVLLEINSFLLCLIWDNLSVTVVPFKGRVVRLDKDLESLFVCVQCNMELGHWQLSCRAFH